MNNLVLDETKEIQIIEDYRNFQIFKTNTNHPEVFIQGIKDFFELLGKKVDPNGTSRAIYIFEKMPPLTSIMTTAELNMPENIKWTYLGGIKTADESLMLKFLPIILYGFNLTTKKEQNYLETF